jgi:hypothetical protein
MLTRLLRSLRFGSPRRPHSSAGRTRWRSFMPSLEVLERRALPSTLTVTSFRDTGDGSLRGEIAAARPGDTIDFQPGLHGSILLGSTLSLTKNLVIQGNRDATGSPLVALDGQHQVRDILVNAGVTVSLVGLGITNGYAQYTGSDAVLGGGILNQGTLTVQNCTITGNRAGLPQPFGSGDVGFITGQGGGIYNVGALTVQDSILSGNTAGGWGQGGALMNGTGQWVSLLPRVWRGATAAVTGCTITGNTASTGGGIYQTSAGGGLTLQNSTISGTTATLDAGGLCINASAGGSTLTAAVNASATTLAVQNALSFARGETIHIDNEQMIVTGVDTVRNTLTVTRGANHTTAAAHLSGARLLGLTTCLDAFTVVHLGNNLAPSNPNCDGLYLTCR